MAYRPRLVALTTCLLLAACSSTNRAAPNPTTSDPTASSVAQSTQVGTSSTVVVTTSIVPTAPVPHFVDENGFDDHTVPTIDSVAELLAMSRAGVGGQTSLKFTIPDFDRPLDSTGLARTHLLDGNFYNLHDEWYMYRLLNGQAVPGSPVAPVDGQRFTSIQQIYQWAQAIPVGELPLDLKFSNERLYSAAFYDLVLNGTPRRHGVGSIVRFPDASGEVRWLIELEYSDLVSSEVVRHFFERLAVVLPVEVATKLEWVVRSPQQELVATQMVQQALPYGDRVVHYRDLVPPGSVSVYNPGVAAGRLLYVGEGGADFGDAKTDDIIVTEHVPDWLPPGRGLITSDLQTPLAHVSLLARNRGIPNVSQVGVHEDAGLRQAARIRAHAIVVARGTSLQVALITPEQYKSIKAAQQPTPVAVPTADVGSMPLVVNLTELVADLGRDGLSQAEIDHWRPIIGGKSAGFLTLLSTPGLTPPPDPLAITIRGYVEHLAPLRPLIAAAIADPALRDSARARWLTLEGSEDYGLIFPSPDDASFAARFEAQHPPGSPVGDVLAAGGVRALVGSQPVAASTLQAIIDELERTYAAYDVSTGLRFRSSSSVEDIEGFNGAGLYTSYTGYLRPELLEDAKDHDATIERALLRAWASYWSFEAFEERRLERIDHFSGAMGMTVHARFDDDHERNNGVVTFTYLPGGDLDDAVVDINVQVGSVAVTNPDADQIELPEVLSVSVSDGQLKIERVATSTLMAAGQQVLADSAVREIVEQTTAVANAWRARLNQSLDAQQQLQTVVLDFEFKEMEAGWPALANGAKPYPARLVLRQVRSLDPGLRRVPADVRALPIPRDVLMRASLVETSTCTGDTVQRIEVHTDPLSRPDMGYDKTPLVIGPSPQPGADCVRRTVFTSPEQALLAMVASPGAFVILG